MILRLTKRLTLSLCMFAALMARAQSDTAGADNDGAADPPHSTGRPPQLTMFDHPANHPWLLSGQANIIFQAHPAFHSPYAGPNSLLARGEYKVSLVGTLYLALEANKNPRYHTDLVLDFESAGGRGVSEALGLAGFTNLDVVRNPNLGSKPYL